MMVLWEMGFYVVVSSRLSNIESFFFLYFASCCSIRYLKMMMIYIVCKMEKNASKKCFFADFLSNKELQKLNLFSVRFLARMPLFEANCSACWRAFTKEKLKNKRHDKNLCQTLEHLAKSLKIIHRGKHQTQTLLKNKCSFLIF